MLSTDAPFLLLILLGIAGWGIPQLIDRAAKGDPIELTTLFQEDRSGKQMFITVRNLSKSKSYGDLIFILRSRDGFSYADIIDEAPARVTLRAPEIYRDYVRYKIDTLHPGAQFTMFVEIDGEITPHLLLESSKQPVLLVESGFSTWLIRYETHIIMSIVMLAIGMSVLLFIVYIRSYRKKDKNK